MVNNRWARLSQSEKAELLGIYTSMGYNDLASIIAHYNSCGGKLHASGGPVTNTAKYKSDAYLYNPPVNIGAPIEVPLRYKPLPDYGDYDPQRTTGMLEDIPIELGLEMPQRGYGVLMPNAPSAMPTLDARQDAARRIMAVENSKNNVNGGYDAKTGRWYPHKSHEGGADTIAYGIKLSNGTPEAALALKQGYLTDEQAVSSVDSLVQKYYDAAKRVYDGKYGAGEWDKLSDKSQSILVDYSYNPGLAKFPKLMEGFHSGNLDLIRKNYKRYSGGKELGRNKVLLEELDTLENEYPIFRAEGGRLFEDGGPEEKSSGWNIGAALLDMAKKKYLEDYAKRGYVYSYPKNPIQAIGYALSPYIRMSGHQHDINESALPQEVNARRALFAKNFGVDTTGEEYGDAIVESKYRPSVSSDSDAKYYTLAIEDPELRLASLKGVMGKYKIDFGEDENGKYMSVYDKWDLAPFTNDGSDFPGTTPPEIYDRFYRSDLPKLYDYYFDNYGNPREGAITVFPSNGMSFDNGGKIHTNSGSQGRLYGPGGAIGGTNPITTAYRIARDKYLTDYANNGRMVGYPESIGKAFTYAASPYLGLDEWEAPERRALFSQYFGLGNTEYNPSDYIEESKYKPSKSSDKDAKYYTYKNDVYRNFNTHNGLYKLDIGTDDEGRSYVSLYDKWDIDPFKSIFGLGKGTDSALGGTPVEMYDRIYSDEQPELYDMLLKRYKKQNHIDYASGGKIHIKPENRGKFTALKKRTGHSASWFKAHGTPAQKKMAVFELNSRHWNHKHSDGGRLFSDISDIF